jgi:hypothetical protein
MTWQMQVPQVADRHENGMGASSSSAKSTSSPPPVTVAALVRSGRLPSKMIFGTSGM